MAESEQRELAWSLVVRSGFVPPRGRLALTCREIEKLVTSALSEFDGELKGKYYSLETMTESEKKQTFKPKWKRQFKGKCHYCGEQGHKAIDCVKRKNDAKAKKEKK